MATPRKTPTKRSAAEVQELISLARAQGLRSLKVDGVEFEFSAPPAAPDQPPAGAPGLIQAAVRQARARGRPVPSGHGFLFWSTDEAIDFADGTTDAPQPPDPGKAPDLKPPS